MLLPMSAFWSANESSFSNAPANGWPIGESMLGWPALNQPSLLDCDRSLLDKIENLRRRVVHHRRCRLGHDAVTPIRCSVHIDQCTLHKPLRRGIERAQPKALRKCHVPFKMCKVYGRPLSNDVLELIRLLPVRALQDIGTSRPLLLCFLLGTCMLVADGTGMRHQEHTRRMRALPIKDVFKPNSSSRQLCGWRCMPRYCRARKTGTPTASGSNVVSDIL